VPQSENIVKRSAIHGNSCPIFDTAQSANANEASKALSSAPSTAFSVLDSSDLSLSESKGGVVEETSFSVDYIGYEGID
jgi:hypothetical protein